MFTKDLFGKRILEQRTRCCETQAVLAELLGVKKNHISEIERGNRTTSAERIALICEHYKVSADYLLGLTDDPEPKYRAETDG
ncbi:XRE family transcriptional regulator [bacterium 1xD42-67]|nr:XRE family transcriptional regulator [bacterium 1xD42-67]